MWITRCLAEAAEEAAPAADTFGSPDIIDLIIAAMGLFYLVVGIMTMVTKKFYGGLEKGYAKYTTESVQNCIIPIGLQYTLVGLCMIAFCATALLHWTWPPRLILIGVFLVVIIIAGLGMNKKLVKK